VKQQNGSYSLSNAPTDAADSYEYVFTDEDFEQVEGEKYPTKRFMAYAEPVQAHINSGLRDVRILREILNKYSWIGGNVLDYGCSNGRMTRLLKDHIPEAQEVFGMDIDCRRVFWALNYISEKANFIPCNSSYHLPFSDQYLSLVTFYSMFTHFDESAFAWLQELRRVLTVGGVALITLHDHEALKNLEKFPDHTPIKKGVQKHIKEFTNEKSDLSFFQDHTGTVLQTFISRKMFEKCCSNSFRILETRPNTMGGFQTLYVLQKVK